MQKLLVILDLDETLIYGTEVPLDRPCDFVCGHYYIYRRPGLSNFITNLRNRFQVAVWTSSSPDYAQCVVRNIFPQGYPLQFLWSSERCSQRFDPDTGNLFLLKNLKKLKRRGYDLNRVVTIDDSPEKYGKSYGNLIRVHEYEGEENEDELQLLFQYLCILVDEPNVRHVEKRRWKACLGTSNLRVRT